MVNLRQISIFARYPIDVVLLVLVVIGEVMSRMYFYDLLHAQVL